MHNTVNVLNATRLSTLKWCILCYGNLTLIKNTTKNPQNNEIMMIDHKALEEQQVSCFVLFFVFFFYNFSEFLTVINQYVKNYPLKIPNKALM